MEYIKVMLPPDRRYYCRGLWYKKGLFDYMYYWLDDKWVRSSETEQEIKEQVAREKRIEESLNNAK